MNEWFWIWIGLVVIFSVAEIIEGGGFIGPWALGATAAAGCEALSLSIDWQWIAFIGVSSLIFVGWQRIVHPVPRRLPADVPAETTSGDTES